MRGNHIHLGVRDLAAVLEWLERVCHVIPTYQTARMAILPFGDVGLILDESEEETSATLGYHSDDCDEDFRAIVARGAAPIEGPSDRTWGVRVAYVQGPGRLRLEIEQPLASEASV